jgi:hypothetical protein
MPLAMMMLHLSAVKAAGTEMQPSLLCYSGDAMLAVQGGAEQGDAGDAGGG